MAKQILYDLEARKKIAEGVHQLARAVKATLGPAGRLAILNKSFGAPAAVNDGVTVAKEIELPDPFQNMGAKLVQEVASKTNDEAGDGTSTATVIAEAILDEGMKMLAAGVAPMDLKRGISKAAEVAIGVIKDNAKKIKSTDELKAVATISANQDAEIGGLMATALEKVGQEGVVTIEEGKGLQTELDYVDGMKFDKGYMSPYFMTDPKSMTATFDNALILFCEKKISSVRELIPLLEKVSQSGKPLLIVCEDMETEVLTTLVVNRLRGSLQICAVKAPGFGDRRKAMLEDMAILTGGQAVTEDLGIKLENLELEKLGRAKRVIVDKDNTTVIEGAGKKKDVETRCTQIRNQIAATTSSYDKEKLEERLAKLVGGVAVIKVGGHTEAEMKERKYRVEDALNATRAARQEGIVPGGAVAYLRAAQAIEDAKFKGDETYGAKVLAAALYAPITQIAENAGQDGRVVCETVKEKKVFNFGYNALTGEYGDMVKMGVLDPAKVARCAIQNAASVAGLILTTNTLVTDVKEKKAVAGATA